MAPHSLGTDQCPVVIAPLVGGTNGVSMLRIIPIWVASIIVHLAIMLLAGVLFAVLAHAQAAPLNDSDELLTTTRIEEQPKEFDLTDTNLGDNDPLLSANNRDRIEDVVVPGMVADPAKALGVPGVSDGAAQHNVPSPLGVVSLTGDDLSNPEGGFLSGRGSRSGPSRVKRLAEGGGNARSEASVGRGLEWLALHQAQDGHWSLHEFNHSAREKPRPAGKIHICNCGSGSAHRNDIAATGFGLLPFLAGGITHRPNKTFSRDYTKTVDGALNWLLSKQSKEGSFSGDMYAHGIATIAMCEAYGLTSDPRLKQSAQRALNFIVYAQDGEGGGWRYAPKQAGDTSVTGWQVMALKSGQMAGLSVPRKTLKLSERFLESCETSKKGGYSYTPGSGETIAMTAVGLLCRQYSGVNPRNPGLLAGVQRLKAAPPGKNDNIYYLYYATQVMHHMQGESWRFWNDGMDENGKKLHSGMRDSLISKQDHGTTPKHPHQIGSWSGSPGGRIMATSLSLLCLEVYYRHLPLYRRDTTFTKENK